MWACAEIGHEVDRIDVGGSFGGTKTPEYLAMNPNALVPVYQDGDLVLFESPAIVRYLGATYGSEEFWPHNPAKRAKLDVWAEWTKTTVLPVLIGQIFWTLVRTPKAEQDPKKLSLAAENLADLMLFADERIGSDKYLGGDALSFADIMFGHALYRYYTLEFERRDYENLAAYYQRLQSRAHYRKHVMIDYSSLRVD
jgi:glutathione S-transferase